MDYMLQLGKDMGGGVTIHDYAPYKKSIPQGFQTMADIIFDIGDKEVPIPKFQEIWLTKMFSFDCSSGVNSKWG